MDKVHIVLTGEMGVGKSTLVRRLLEEKQGADAVTDAKMIAESNVKNSPRIGGFFTKKVEGSDNESAHVELYSISEDLNLVHQTVGLCHSEGRVTAYPDVFDTFGVACLNGIDTELWVMDELGFIELEAHGFRSRVMTLLSEDTPVIAVVKKRSNPFLEEVRHHPKVRVFEVTIENRERIFEELKERINKK